MNGAEFKNDGWICLFIILGGVHMHISNIVPLI